MVQTGVDMVGTAADMVGMVDMIDMIDIEKSKASNYIIFLNSFRTITN